MIVCKCIARQCSRQNSVRNAFAHITQMSGLIAKSFRNSRLCFILLSQQITLHCAVSCITQEDDEAALDARREVVRQSVQQQLDQPNLFLGHPKLAPQHPQPAPASAQLQEGSRSEADSFEDARSCLLDSLSREQSLKSKQEEAAGPSCTGEKDKKGQQGSGGSVQEAAGSEKKSAPSTLESVYEHFMVPKEQEDALPELFLCLEVREMLVFLLEQRVDGTGCLSVRSDAEKERSAHH